MKIISDIIAEGVYCGSIRLNQVLINLHTSKPIDMEVLTHLLSRYLQLKD